MKKMIYLIAAAALATACSQDKNSFTITGTVQGASDGDTIFLQRIEGRRNIVKEDTALIKNAKFTFTGKQDTTAYRYLTYKSQTDQGMAMDFFLENGTIQVQLSVTDQSATGTPSNDAYQKIRSNINALTKRAEAVYASLADTTLTDAQREEKGKELTEFNNQMMQVAKDGIKENISNAVGVHLLKQNYYYMTVDELDPLMSQVPDAYAQDKAILRIKDTVAKMKATAVGQKFTDFTMKTPDGKEVKLSDFVGKGKVVLVDFWASWCGPCRREMPNLVEAYKQYKKKKFEIVGVSLDRNIDDWKKAIKELNITWPQMSDLKFWDCEGAKLYAVSGIPHVILIDGEGTILARGLYGEELLKKLAEILK